MINKYYKIIHNKYSRFFKFIFFLRYLFGLFVVTTIIFLIIPNFFDYDQRSKVFEDHLIKNYGLKISQYEKIEFNSFPLPNIELKNILINIDSISANLTVKKLKIYPKFLSIHNYQNFQSSKIVIKNSKINLEVLDLRFFLKNLINQKNDLHFDDLNIKINNNTNSLVLLENIKFTNYGYKKNIIEGKIFDKKFKTKINNKLSNIDFKLLQSGLNVNIKLDEENKNNSISGVFKSKILNTNLKFDFNYNNSSLNIYNSFFRNKNLSFKSQSIITLEPFLDSSSKFEIEDIDLEIFKKLKIEKLLELKNILKQVNTSNEFNFYSKKFNHRFVDKFKLKFDLAYGRLNYSKNLSLSDDVINCNGNINLLEELPLLFFDCSIYSDSKRELLKKFNINKKKDDKTFILNAKGNLSILNQKINFKDIVINESYKASNEDLIYFKENFENILFNEDFVGIFNFKKIKEFILEIS